MPNAIAQFGFVKKSGDIMSGDLDLGAIGNLILAAGKTVDGIDVSELQVPVGGLYLSTEQSNITHDLLTLVNLETVPYGFNDGIENPATHRITVNKNGLYLIVAQLTYGYPEVDALHYMYVRKNTTTNIIIASHVIHVSENHNLPGAKIDWLANNDYLELYALQEGITDTVDIVKGEMNTFLAVVRLR